MITSETSPEQTAEAIRIGLEQLATNLPPVANIIEAFKELFVVQAHLRETISAENGMLVPEIDPERFRQGSPVLGKEAFLTPEKDLRSTAELLIPAIQAGFPAIRSDMTSIADALHGDRLKLEDCVKNLLRDKLDNVAEAASEARIDANVLSFFTSQLIAPFAQRIAAFITPLPEELQWLKGYCPICGSWPMMSSLRGEEGRRMLTCSFCSHEWQFMRTACPFCENEDHETLEYFYSAERTSERAEVCNSCKRYIVGVDLRDRVDNVVMDVAPLGLVYLDILAQEKGYLPGAVTAWNVLDHSGRMDHN